MYFPNEHLHDTIKRYLTFHKIYLSELAKQCKTTYSTFSKVYNGTRPISLSLLYIICSKLQVSPEELLGCPLDQYEFANKYDRGEKAVNVPGKLAKARTKSVITSEIIPRNKPKPLKHDLTQPNKDGIKYKPITYMMIEGKKVEIAKTHPPMPERRKDETFDEYYDRLRSGII